MLGTILNEIVEDGDGELALRFTFTLTIEGIAPGSAAEQDFAGQMEQGYLMAVTATLKAMRKLVADNALTRGVVKLRADRGRPQGGARCRNFTARTF